ncbi:hypothetical protein [Ulvibacterium marinum]|uniref:hypothetical protein n=1 Tax=Ulvibacterium marinum TaxID=2419782 RepID=UPI002493E0AD|nr:hypothetical protein [Ulvibacterium marinum]
MKTVVFSLVFVLAGFTALAQDTSDLIAVGDVMSINVPENGSFAHVHFPRKNLIIKRGGIADMKRVHGNKVVVTGIKTISNGNTMVTLKRKDGRKFFKFLPSVKADLENALAKGELKMPNSSNEDEIARR